MGKLKDTALPLKKRSRSCGVLGVSRFAKWVFVIDEVGSDFLRPAYWGVVFFWEGGVPPFWRFGVCLGCSDGGYPEVSVGDRPP